MKKLRKQDLSLCAVDLRRKRAIPALRAKAVFRNTLTDDEPIILLPGAAADTRKLDQILAVALRVARPKSAVQERN